MQEALETPGGSAGYERRMTKVLAKTPKPAGLSKPGKTDTPKPPGTSKASKPDATKQAGLSKPVKAVEKVGNV